MKKHILFIAFILLFALCLTACGDEEDSGPHMVMDINEVDGKTVYRRDGTEQRGFHVEDGEKYEVSVWVERDSGELDITIHEENNTEAVIYTGTDIPTSEFKVYAEKAGSYIVDIKASDFYGNYGFEFSKVSESGN